MRLQGAIFDGESTLLAPSGRPLPGVKEFLSLLKLEDVWLYLTCDGSPADLQARLEETGLRPYFRGVISAAEHGGDPLAPELYEKAVRRLRTIKRNTMIFTGRESLLEMLKADGFYVTLVGEGHSPTASALADACVRSYPEMLQRD